MTEQEEKRVWNDAIDAVLELMRIHPPHRIGEADFIRRLVKMKGLKNERAADKQKRR